MTYDNFLKKQYQRVFNTLKQAKSYNGDVNLAPASPLFLSDSNKYCHIISDNKSDFMPSFELNINAPINVYEEWFDYFMFKYPGLAKIFIGSEQLKVIHNEIGKFDDDTINAVMDELFRAAFQLCLGVLNYAD